MRDPIYFRIFGYLTILLLHTGNAIVMGKAINGITPEQWKHPGIKNFANMQYKYLTIWNMTFQMIYASVGLVSDILTLTGKRNKFPLLELPIKYKATFLQGVLYPCTMLVFQLFWPSYLYDRELVFPTYIDLILHHGSNQIMHAAIAPFVIWETIFTPRSRPKSQKNNIIIISILYVAYNIVLFYTYFTENAWPYPLLNVIHNTIYMPVFFAYIYVSLIFHCYAQWYITDFVWGNVKCDKIE